MSRRIVIVLLLILVIFSASLYWYFTYLNASLKKINAPNLIEVEDMDGRSIAIPKKTNRTVVLSGGVVELMYIWGIGDKLVGTTSFIKEHPIIGMLIGNSNVTEVGFSASNINIEKILALKPDLVITYSPKYYNVPNYEDKILQIENNGIPVIFVYVRSIPDFYNLIFLIGKIFNLGEPANSTIAYIQSVMSLVKSEASKIPENQRVKVLFLYGSATKIQVQGGTSFINDLIENAGGENVAKNKKEEYVSTSLEEISSWNPDVIVLWSYPPEFSPEYVMSISSWSNVNAVKYKRVFKQPESLDGSIWTIRSALFDVWLLKAFYPNTSINFSKVVNDFSRRFYNFSLTVTFNF